jgi:hypothetical protein
LSVGNDIHVQAIEIAEEGAMRATTIDVSTNPWLGGDVEMPCSSSSPTGKGWGVKGTLEAVVCPKTHGAIGRDDDSMDNSRLM